MHFEKKSVKMSVKRQQMVKLQFYARKLTDLDFFTKSDPFLSISKRHKVTNNYSRVRKTETINNNLNPDWGFLYMSLQELCDGDADMKLQVEVFDEDNTSDKLIGAAQLSLKDFQEMSASGKSVSLVYKGKNRGQLYVKQCIVDQPSFEDRVASAGNQIVPQQPAIFSQPPGQPSNPYPAPTAAAYPAASNPYPAAATNNYSAASAPYPSPAAPYPNAGASYPTAVAPYPGAGVPYPCGGGAGGLYPALDPGLSLPYPPQPATGAPPAGPWCPQR